MIFDRELLIGGKDLDDDIIELRFQICQVYFV